MKLKKKKKPSEGAQSCHRALTLRSEFNLEYQTRAKSGLSVGKIPSDRKSALQSLIIAAPADCTGHCALDTIPRARSFHLHNPPGGGKWCCSP